MVGGSDGVISYGKIFLILLFGLAGAALYYFQAPIQPQNDSLAYLSGAHADILDADFWFGRSTYGRSFGYPLFLALFQQGYGWQTAELAQLVVYLIAGSLFIYVVLFRNEGEFALATLLGGVIAIVVLLQRQFFVYHQQVLTESLSFSAIIALFSLALFRSVTVKLICGILICAALVALRDVFILMVVFSLLFSAWRQAATFSTGQFRLYGAIGP